MEEMVKFRKNVFEIGGSSAITIPRELVEYLDLHHGDEVVIIGDRGKHGKYVAIFKEEPNYEFSELKK